ncbi:MAG TPA: ribonuclease E activity regulator RraA [Rhodocyclaceae bacterium]|nr:ribonuclease E activity regulator RraA [Rhodocyclaceae bacterium]
MTFATADLCDQHEELIRAGSLRIVAPMFRSFGGRPAFGGQISTLKLFEDNSFVRKALEQPGRGRVLVIDGGGSLRRALVGDQLAALGARNGWSGIVVYGCIRDAAAIGVMDIGVFALATHPQKTDKKNIGEIEIPISFGGVTFRPGEWLYADVDGVLVADQTLAG